MTTTAKSEIGLSAPDITQAEIDAVVEVMSSGRLSLGPRVDAFERAVAEYCGTKHAIAISSGTSGLHLLMRAIGVKPGTEVITTPFSFVASSNCIMFEGGKPVFVDIDPKTWNIDHTRVAEKITDRTVAMIPVDAFGLSAELEPLKKICKQHKLRMIEDSCEALGAIYHGKRAGSQADAGVFGFYPNKQITTGEGGMIVTSDDEIDRLCRSMRNQGRDTGMGWLSHERLGYNYRLPDINCAIGIVQMQRIEEILGSRVRVANMYLERLRGETRISMQHIPEHCGISWFVFVVKLNDDYSEEQRNNIIQTLRGEGIGCSNYFAPIHLQKFYAEEFGYKVGDFPVCEAVAARTIALPFHCNVTEREVDTVCTALQRLL